jgi:hypothetical protein
MRFPGMMTTEKKNIMGNNTGSEKKIYPFLSIIENPSVVLRIPKMVIVPMK